MCSVLLNASVDVRYENPETVGDPVAVSVIAFYHPRATSIISIGSYPGLSNKLFTKARERVCAFTVRALFVSLVVARRSRGTCVFGYFTSTTKCFLHYSFYFALAKFVEKRKVRLHFVTESNLVARKFKISLSG